MTNFKGTKGKWEMCKTYNELDVPSFSITSDEGKIAYCYNLQICRGVQERSNANALLISKAPEMLEMLERIASLEGMFPNVVRNVNKLIKEATEL